MQRIMTWGLVLILSTTFLSSCLKSSTSQPEKLTYLYLMHMASTAPAVDLYFGTQKASSNSISFNTISGSYTGIRPATFDVSYKKGGGDSLVALIPTAVYDTLMPYTLLLYSDESGEGQATRIFDNVEGLSTEKVNFRFWHLAHDIGPVDISIGTNLVDAGRTLADNVGGNTYNRFNNQIDAGTYTITVKEAGTETVVAKQEDVNLVKGASYTIFLKGSATGTGVKEKAVGILRNF